MNAKMNESDIEVLIDEINTVMEIKKENKGYKMIENILMAYKRRLKDIKRILTKKEYKLVFIGSPGDGKTTAICNLLNLLEKEKGGKKLDEISLLSVGGGRTTIADVKIRKTSGKTSIIIEPRSEQVQNNLISDFCRYYLSKKRKQDIYNQEDKYINKNVDLDEVEHSSEILRCIRNMAGFSSENQVIEYIKNEDIKTNDEFEKCILKRIGLEKRKDNKIEFNEEDFCVWLKREFNRINFGYNEKISIPEKINILINEKDYNLKLASYIKEIIDTRGIDSSSRDGLYNYLFQEDTICILTDRYEHAPKAENKEILSKWILKENKDVIGKTALTVLYRKGELSTVNECNNDENEGERIKREEMEQMIDNPHTPLNYNSENTIFINPCSCYKINKTEEEKRIDGKIRLVEKSIVDKYYSEIAEQNNRDFFECINNIIIRNRNRLLKECDKIKENIDSLVSKNTLELNTKEQQELDIIAQAITDATKIALDADYGFEGKFYNILQQYYYSTLRALSIRYGGINPYTCSRDDKGKDYYHYRNNIYDETEISVKNQLLENIKQAKSLIDLKLAATTDDFVKTLTDGFTLIINEKYLQMLNEISLNRYNDMLKIFTPLDDTNHFWKRVDERVREGGRGVKNDVIDIYKQHIRLQQMDEVFKKGTLEELKIFFKYISDLFV